MANAGVFISHATADIDTVREIARRLTAGGCRVRMADGQIAAGESIVTFVDDALRDCRYCLLLWSAAAERSLWVQAEWQAAFTRGLAANRAFLNVARLDDTALPTLLAPRLAIDLRRSLARGVDTLLRQWRSDRGIEGLGSGPVAPGPAPSGEMELWVSSDLFDFTWRCCADPDAPAGILLDDILRAARLPPELSIDGRLGLTLAYWLDLDGTPLRRSRSLAAQGVRARSVLQLVVRAQPYAPTSTWGAAVMRGTATATPLAPDALDVLRAVVAQGRTSPPRGESDG